MNPTSPSAQSFSATVLPKLSCILTSISILITYTIAVAKGDVKPFPNTTITNTAVNYPQYIIFRIGNLTAIPIMALVLIIVYWWLSAVKDKMKQRFQNSEGAQLPYITKWIIPLGFFGAFLFAMTVATISDGYMNDALHLTAAVSFFVVMCIDFVVITFTVQNLRSVNPSFITKFSYYSKWFVCFCYFAVLTSIIIIVVVNGGSIPQPAIDAIEWITTTLLVLYIGTFISDFENLNVTIENGISLSWANPEMVFKSAYPTSSYSNGYSQLEMTNASPAMSFVGGVPKNHYQHHQHRNTGYYHDMKAPWLVSGENCRRVTGETANGYFAVPPNPNSMNYY